MLKFQFVRTHTFCRNIKQFSLSTFVFFAFLAFAFYERLALPNTQSYNARLVSPTLQEKSADPLTIYKDGVYTGPAMPAGYGRVQVKAIVQDGKIFDVEFIDYPHDRQTSQQINAQAMPWLRQEAIQAQSAQVNIVSGATLTSKAFVDSLQMALQSAQN